jgi:hypothetical protein
MGAEGVDADPAFAAVKATGPGDCFSLRAISTVYGAFVIPQNLELK